MITIIFQDIEGRSKIPAHLTYVVVSGRCICYTLLKDSIKGNYQYYKLKKFLFYQF